MKWLLTRWFRFLKSLGKSCVRRRVKPTLLAERLECRALLAAYVVNTTSDLVASDGVISLREAIQAANLNAAVTSDVAACRSMATRFRSLLH